MWRWNIRRPTHGGQIVFGEVLALEFGLIVALGIGALLIAMGRRGRPV